MSQLRLLMDAEVREAVPLMHPPCLLPLDRINQSNLQRHDLLHNYLAQNTASDTFRVPVGFERSEANFVKTPRPLNCQFNFCRDCHVPSQRERERGPVPPIWLRP